MGSGRIKSVLVAKVQSISLRGAWRAINALGMGGPLACGGAEAEKIEAVPARHPVKNTRKTHAKTSPEAPISWSSNPNYCLVALS